MIDPRSASFPILGAALAAGVAYGLALELAFCIVHLRIGDDRRFDALAAVEDAHGEGSANDLLKRLKEARDDGRLWNGGVA